MPTRNVNLTEELDQFILSKIASGRYENASEVVRDALRGLERDERTYAAKLAALRAAIEAGDASGIFKGGPFASVREKRKRLIRSRTEANGRDFSFSNQAEAA